MRWEAKRVRADLNERLLVADLLPFREEGNTSSGRMTIPGAEVVTLPADPDIVTLNLDHDSGQPVGRAVSLEATENAVRASFRIARTPEGDAALADAADPNGKRRSVSAEFDVHLDGTTATAVRIFAAALVERPAFPSARVLAEEATEADGEHLALEADALPEDITVTTPEGESATYTPDAEPEAEEPLTAAAAAPTESETPVSLPDTTVHAAASEAAPLSLSEMNIIAERVHAGSASPEMLARIENRGGFVAQTRVFAALSDVKYDASGSPVVEQRVPQWLGDIYTGNEFEQKYLPLIGHGDLTSKKFAGYKWNVKPAGAAWAGNKTNVPSNSPTTTPFEGEAELWAGGHDIAIEHRLFGHAGYFEAHGAAMIESYKRWADAKVFAAIDTAATANDIMADNPAGLDAGAGVSALIDGIFEVYSRDYTPTFALIAPDVYKSIFKTNRADILGYVSATLGFKSGELNGFEFRIANELDPGTIIVGTRSGMTALELPGVPVRAEAPDLVKGGLDVNYYAALGVAVTNPAAFALVTPYTVGG
ncbi:hypothetical protein [Microbacterium sp. Ag1]|uniref:hypothetical protein n=1 Tax=Microbacterium sp. Ag1 TaxID=1643443 RepID=UPI000629CC9D|nr:hypothetical protein [Microbacterium sp. Ag1]KKX97193.1 hypothetical protein AAY78_14545 [Microbacterium sp. Ag1]